MTVHNPFITLLQQFDKMSFICSLAECHKVSLRRAEDSCNMLPVIDFTHNDSSNQTLYCHKLAISFINETLNIIL